MGSQKQPCVSQAGSPPPHTAHSRTRSGFRCGSAKRSPTWNHRKRTDDSRFGLSTANDSHVREHAPSPTIQQIAVQTQSLGRKRLFQVGRGLRISNRETARGYRGAGPLPAGGKRPGSFLPMSPAASQSPMVPKAVSPAPAATSSSTLRLHTNTIYLLIDGSSGVPPPSLQPDPKLQTHRFNVPRDSPVRKPGGHSGRDRYKPAPFNPKRLRPQLPKPGQKPLRPSGGSGPSLAIVPGPSARPVPTPVSNPTQKSGRVASGVPWPIV